MCVGTDLASSRGGGGAGRGASPTCGRPSASTPTTPSRLDDGVGRRSRRWPATRRGRGGIGETGFDLHYEHSPRDDAGGGVPRPGRARARARPRARDPLARRVGRHVPRARRRGRPARARCSTASPAGPTRRSARARPRRAPVVQRHRVVRERATTCAPRPRSTPLDRVLVETDAPYLAPVPHRGRPNQPGVGRRRRRRARPRRRAPRSTGSRQ